jgi:endonuclease VIII
VLGIGTMVLQKGLIFVPPLNMEGPSLVILKEEVQAFKGKKILRATGYADLDYSRLKNKTVIDFKTWGKHFIIVFPTFSLRIHFLLFGTYFINKRKETDPKVALKFSNGDLNCYVCSARFIEEPLDEVYDWEVDLLSPTWNFRKVKKLFLQHPDQMVCDVLLDPLVFSGSGNIIKNEALYRAGIHPETLVKNIPPKKVTELIRATYDYTQDFLKWKKEFVLSRNWKVYGQKVCRDCGGEVIKKYNGKLKRRSFICGKTQKLYK